MKSAKVTSNVCVFCGKQCRFNNELYHHIRGHIEEKPFDCKLCDKSFTHLNPLYSHLITHTGEKPFKCDICSKRFNTKQSMKRHQNPHTTRKSNKLICICVFCGMQCKFNDQLYHHIRIHIEEKPFDCKLCDKSFPHADRLHSHIRTHTGEKPYKCDICGKRFNQKHGLKKHLIAHTTTKLYQCQICDKTFTTIWYLDRHKLTHNPVITFKCTFCVRYFFSKRSFKFHLSTHAKLGRFKCLICESLFAFKYQLRKHSETHEPIILNKETTKEKNTESEVKNLKQNKVSVSPEFHPIRVTPHKCNICNKFFAQRICLRIHQQLHRGEKTFECSHCGKKFVLKAYLDSHMYTHMKNTPFKCHLCIKSYFSKTALKTHLLKHMEENPSVNEDTVDEDKIYSKKFFKRLQENKATLKTAEIGEKFQCEDIKLKVKKSSSSVKTKTHKCDLCNKYFSQKISLRLHQEIHKGEKNFLCTHCGKQFVLKAYLDRHMYTHMKETPFKCHLCIKSYSSTIALKTHLFKHKNDGTNSTVETVNENEKYSQKIFPQVIQEQRPKSQNSKTVPQKICESHLITGPDMSASELTTAALKCDICHEFFAGKRGLKIHQQIHNNGKKFQCTRCDKRFALESSLSSHVYTHMENKPFKCHLCIKSYSSTVALKYHLIKHKDAKIDAQNNTVDVSERYSQKVFQKVIHTGKYVPNKKVSDNKTKQNNVQQAALVTVCEYCGKVFDRKENYKTHLKFIHFKIRDQECKLCGKIFVVKGGLTRHMKSHTGIKPFKCDLCSKAFSENANLKIHKQKMHAGDDKAKCENEIKISLMNGNDPKKTDVADVVLVPDNILVEHV